RLRAPPTSRPSAAPPWSWRDLARSAERPADAADLPFEADAEMLEDAPAHLLAQALDVGGAGVAGVDEEIRVLLRDHGAAAAETAAAGAVDQLPGLVSRRIGEGRAAGARANRLARAALRLDLGHPLLDPRRIARRSPQHGAGEDPILGNAAVAVGEPHLGRCELVPGAFGIERGCLHQHVLDLAPIGAGIHAQRAADRAGDAGEELEAGEPGVARDHRAVEAELPGAGSGIAAPRPDLGESPPEPDHHALDAAVAHQPVRGDADHGDGD